MSKAHRNNLVHTNNKQRGTQRKNDCIRDAHT